MFIIIKKIGDGLERVVFIFLSVIIAFPIIVFVMDYFNVSENLGLTNNLNIEEWTNFLSSYTSSVISSFIDAVILVSVTYMQIRANNRDSIDRDKENLRIQNMPILSYDIDSKKPKEEVQCKFIKTTIEDGNIYYLNIIVKNVGLSAVKDIKMDLKIDSLSETQRIIGKDTICILDKDNEFVINTYFSLKNSQVSYNIEIVAYYEDLLSNWYEQKTNVKYAATNIFLDGQKIGNVEYKVEEEQRILEENVNNKYE